MFLSSHQARRSISTRLLRSIFLPFSLFSFTSFSLLVGSSLNKVAHNLSVTLGSKVLEETAAASRKEYFKKVVEAVDYEHESAVERKKMIEKRKEGESKRR